MINWNGIIFQEFSMWKLINTLLTFSLIWGAPVHAQTGRKYWLYFKDKGLSSSAELGKLSRSYLSERAIKRRILRGNPDKIFDESDVPVYQPYIDQIQNMGFKIKRKSKWLNAVSGFSNFEQIKELENLYFVKKATPVRTFIRTEDYDQKNSLKKRSAEATQINNYSFDYGPSLTQVQMINVPKLHDEGYSGNGVLIGILDSGFNYKLHNAFKHINVIAEWDFVFDDGVTSNEIEDSLQVPPKGYVEQHNHGTQVLSAIGGFSPGVIIGPAFGASYLLAKTEFIPSETRIEEDNWVAGLEWADSLGVDIVSTSTGYINFDDGFIYSYQDLDGQTMVTSKAASMATMKGIVVVAAAGNEAINPETPNWPYVISPADGLGVIAVGAVNYNGTRAPFSSIGPTGDGRIKPDVMAMGVSVVVVNPNSSSGIGLVKGTSFSTPIVSGVCALLLEKNPNWTPFDIWKALTTTATRAYNPDNEYGYGIINSWEAAQKELEIPGSVKIYETPGFINTLLGYSRFYLDLPEQEMVNINIFNSLGQKVDGFQSQIPAGQRRSVVWFWPNNFSNGIYFIQIKLKQKVSIQKTVIIH